MFQMCGVFAEFERSMIVERVKAGQARAVAGGMKLGRGRKKPDNEGKVERSADEKRWGMSKAKLEERILALHKGGMGILKIGRTLGVGSGTVQKVLIDRPFREEEAQAA